MKISILILFSIVFLIFDFSLKKYKSNKINNRIKKFLSVYEEYDKKIKVPLLFYRFIQPLSEMKDDKEGFVLLKLSCFLSLLSISIIWFYSVDKIFPLIAIILLPALMLIVFYRIWCAKELEKFTESLPNNIDIFSRLMQAGVPLEKAINSLAMEADGLFSREMTKIYQQTLIGQPLTKALADSATRINNVEYQFYTIVLSLNQDAGGALASTLLNLSKNMRRRQAVGRKLLTLTSEGRASANIVLLIPVFMMGIQFYLSPENVYFLLQDPAGKEVLMYSVTLMLIGFFWIKRLSKI